MYWIKLLRNFPVCFEYNNGRKTLAVVVLDLVSLSNFNLFSSAYVSVVLVVANLCCKTFLDLYRRR